MSAKYKILYVTELLHDYYANKESKDFEIFPSAETLKVLAGHGMLYKVIGNKLVVLVRTNADNIPVISLSSIGKLTFYLKVYNSQFYNFTNINYKPSQPKCYYFSNLTQNKGISNLHLSSKIPLYNNANAYTVGSLAASNTREVFEALKSNSDFNRHDLSETFFWKSKGQEQYVSSNDLIELAASIYNVTTTPATDFTIRIFDLNPATGIYDVQVKDTDAKTFTSPQSKVAVNLAGLSPGKYRIQVNAESLEIYFDGFALYNNIFGIIEIFNHLPASDDFALFDSAGVSKESTFTIHFANRSVIWKYLAKTTDITAVQDPVHTFTPFASKQFISNEPIPLTEKPIVTVSIHSSIFGDIPSVANPVRDRLQMITKDGDTYFCAEKFLNY